ncbi:MAG: uroporphyrinogen decarboxylase family protein [Phycisphaeraceae bacterium]|jgi:uroporphyrinogen decarboxylase|nr:uroporphyrinogen decarboxylase family protein [Phycisphaeraceae bacterium]
MNPRERFIAALERRSPPGRVPHFELVFFLTMEAFGKVHPSHREYSQWLQMSETERELHRCEMAQLFVDTARRFEHDAIFLHPNPYTIDETIRLIDHVRGLVGDQYFLMLHGDATQGIPDGQQMEQLCVRMAEEPDAVDTEAAARVDEIIRRAETLRDHGGLDGFALCSDYCFNTGPFLPLDWFDRFVTSHLTRLIAAYRDMGFYVIKHTDGNIMPILDRLVDANPHALHSLDPQGGVDIADLIKSVGDRVALCGNVNCGLLQTGTDAQCVESARYALKHGMSAPGYVFCTSNCVYTGMALQRYELILDVWRKEGIRT